MLPRDPFNTAEMKELEYVEAYTERANEYFVELGAAAARNIVTVIQSSAEEVDVHSQQPTTSSTYKTFELGPYIPKDFSPPEANSPGYGDKIFFLKPNQATIVIGKNDRTKIIYNDDGRAKELSNTHRKQRKLKRRGVIFRHTPEPSPFMKQIVQEF